MPLRCRLRGRRVVACCSGSLVDHLVVGDGSRLQDERGDDEGERPDGAAGGPQGVEAEVGDGVDGQQATGYERELLHGFLLYSVRHSCVESLIIIADKYITVNTHGDFDSNSTTVSIKKLPRYTEVVIPKSYGTPDRIRTYGLRLRKPTLYPAELRVQNPGRT